MNYSVRPPATSFATRAGALKMRRYLHGRSLSSPPNSSLTYTIAIAVLLVIRQVLSLVSLPALTRSAPPAPRPAADPHPGA